jgi:hypothetical protein
MMLPDKDEKVDLLEEFTLADFLIGMIAFAALAYAMLGTA